MENGRSRDALHFGIAQPELRRIASVRSAASGEFWQEHSGVLFVLGETGAEFLAQEGLLAAGFDVEREPDDGDREERAHFPVYCCHGPHEREQNPGVDRVTNAAVGARAPKSRSRFRPLSRKRQSIRPRDQAEQNAHAAIQSASRTVRENKKQPLAKGYNRSVETRIRVALFSCA